MQKCGRLVLRESLNWTICNLPFVAVSYRCIGASGHRHKNRTTT